MNRNFKDIDSLTRPVHVDAWRQGHEWQSPPAGADGEHSQKPLRTGSAQRHDVGHRLRHGRLAHAQRIREALLGNDDEAALPIERRALVLLLHPLRLPDDGDDPRPSPAMASSRSRKAARSWFGIGLPGRNNRWASMELEALEVDIAALPEVRFVSAHVTLRIKSELRREGHELG